MQDGVNPVTPTFLVGVILCFVSTYSIIYVTLFATSVLNGLTGIFVLLKNPTNIVHRSFALFAISNALWSASVGLILITGNFFFNQIIFYSAMLMFAGLLLFARVFPRGELVPPRFFLAAIPAVLVMIALPFNIFVQDLQIAPDGSVTPIVGPGMPLCIIVIIGYFVSSLYFLLKNLQRTTGHHRSQLYYLLTGVVILIACTIVFDAVLPAVGVSQFIFVGPLSSVVFFGTTAYAIVRHELMDIKLVIQRGLVYLALFAPLAAAYFGLDFGLESLFSLTMRTNALLSAFVMLCVAALAMYAVERYFEKARLLKVEKEYAALLEREVAERTKHLKELQEYQRRMMDDISHAIQTPVTVIQSAMEDARSDMRHVKTFRIMEKGIDDLSRLARDFLHLSMLESLPDIAHERFSLSDTIAEIAEYAGVVCKENGIMLHQTIERDVPLYADKSQIEELVKNVLSNAIKYTKDSKVRRIHVVLRRTTEHVEIRIEDTGVGIPAKALPHIFERFFKANDSQKGVGLGLSICKRLVELHGGEIAAESIEGRGTTITVRLPAASVAQVRLS